MFDYNFPHKKLKSLLWLPAIFLLMGCLQDIEFKNTKFSQPSPEIALPVVNTSLTLSDLINADTIDNLQENEDHSYKLFFNTGTNSFPLQDFLPDIPDQNHSDSYTVPGDSLIAGQSFTIDTTAKIPFQFDQGHLKQINFSSGNIYLEINSQHDKEIQIDITFPYSKDANGNPISLNNITIVPDSSESRSIDLTGAELNFVEDNGTRKLIVEVLLSSTSSSSDSKISFNAGIKNMEFESIIGYFNNIDVPISPNSFDIPLFSSLKDAKISINPHLRVNILNSFGIPVQADFSNFKLKSQDTTVTLQDEGTGEFFSTSTFPYPESLNDPPVEKSYSITPETSNIEDAFSITPEKFSYDLDFTVGSKTDSSHFIKKDSKIDVGAELEVPLKGSFRNLTLIDTSEFNLSDFNELENLKVVIKTENAFPINVNLQINFLDNSYKIINDENGNPVRLFDTDANILKAATIANEETGETTNAITEDPITATLDKAKLKQIKNAKYMLIRGSLSSVQNGEKEITLYSFYNLKLHLALKAKPSKNISQ